MFSTEGCAQISDRHARAHELQNDDSVLEMKRMWMTLAESVW
ncbi:hypothetical protein SynMITS9220_01792 [Synechococcus sp. MIT S9220]|nr:hypothetical protein SynMITS9220_01792 [Synechococcus sp. MIT S9220]